MNNNFNTTIKPVIGLEVHVELKTKSKMFCGCSADYFGKAPNTHVCPICLGLPGALPVPNKKAIEWCVMIGLALNCEIPLFSKFDRKNYFYPDLPKGYQISQYDQPFCINGNIQLSSGKKIKIRRVHMEEDTAKLAHQFKSQISRLAGASAKRANLKSQNAEEGYSLIDFNRSGVPLVEIVTGPDFESGVEVKEYLQKLQQIVRYLDVSSADMEKGEMRLEPNISLRIKNQKSKIKNKELPSYKVEVKNINSFRFVEKAIDYEIKRQTEVLEKGETPIQETRGWDEDKQKTVTQRAKEEAQDYRYFPEPDIPPIRLSESQILNLKSQMPELPDTKLARFIKEYELSNNHSEVLTRDKKMADFFEEAVRIGEKYNLSAKQIANHVINKKINLNITLAADVISWIVEGLNFSVVEDEILGKTIRIVLEENQKAVEDYKSGKSQVIGFLLGKVKQQFPKADVSQIRTALEKHLK